MFLDKVSLMVCPSMKWQATKCGDVRLTQRLSRAPHHSTKWEPIGHATSTFQIKYELASSSTKWYCCWGWKWWWISAIVDILSIHELGAMINLPTLACSFYAWRVVFLHPPSLHQNCCLIQVILRGSSAGYKDYKYCQYSVPNLYIKIKMSPSIVMLSI